MKSTGIVRKIDQFGRIVLPKELRKVKGIEENKTVMEIFTEEEQIILRKYEPACIFCRETKGVVEFKGKLICKDCLEDIKKSLAYK